MAHTALAAAFVLHRTWIGKGMIKNFRIDSQWRSESFLITIFHISIGKAAMDAPGFWNFRIVSYRHWLGRNGV